MNNDSVELRSLLASAENLLGVIANKQWERLDSKADALRLSVKLVRAALPRSTEEKA